MATIKQLIDNFVWEHLEYYISLVDKDGEDTVIEGVRVLDEPEKFVHGALVNATAQLYIHYVKTGDTRAEVTLKRLNRFIGFIKDQPCKTWGKLSILRALGSLKDASLLDSIAPETLEMLKIKTDYSDFFDKEKMHLKGQASNYNQVAMACAGFRELVGFENEGYCDAIKEKLLGIMSSGAIDGWMDENVPFGRFDRYSMLVTSELSDTLDSIHKPLPNSAAENLRKMAKICIFMANKKGDGINYGRSLSCHGDCACFEALASAFRRGLVDEADKDVALAYSVKILEKTLSFWYNSEKRSFDIWWNGRSTNRYRQSHRVLEVNLDMAMHLLATLTNFELAGLSDTEPKDVIPSPKDWEALEIPFKLGKGETAKTFVFRKNDTLVMLPLIGIGSMYTASAYQPYPAICGVLEAAPEAKMPFLVPEYTLSGGTKARPIQYYDSATLTKEGEKLTVTAKGTLCLMGDRLPAKADGAFTSVFTFEGDSVTAVFTADADVTGVETLIGIHNENDVITPYGFDASEEIITKDVYDFMTPHGAIVKAALYKKNGGGAIGYTAKIPL